MADRSLFDLLNEMSSRILASLREAGYDVGDVYYVDDATGSDDDNGTTWTLAEATIDAAIGDCTADKGDIIFVAPDHEETLADAHGKLFGRLYHARPTAPRGDIDHDHAPDDPSKQPHGGKSVADGEGFVETSILLKHRAHNVGRTVPTDEPRWQQQRKASDGRRLRVEGRKEQR